MAEAAKVFERMSVETFMAWMENQPDRPRWELLDGQPVEMQAERVLHAELKFAITSLFDRDIRARRLPCQVLPDGIAVRIDDYTVFEPDSLVRCGPRLAGDTVLVTDPVIVVEITSPSTQRVDALVKLTRYFRNPSIIHYLIVIPSVRRVLHHRRGGSGQIETRSYDEGVISLDPPGLELDLAQLFAAALDDTTGPPIS